MDYVYMLYMFNVFRRFRLGLCLQVVSYDQEHTRQGIPSQDTTAMKSGVYCC